MPDRAKQHNDAPTPTGRTERPQRADARRNTDALLRAAMAVFAESGVDAPIRQIAEKAGVGVATLYRHFPQRSDLIVAVFRHEVDACADAAPILAAGREPDEALSLWIERYIGFLGAKSGLAAALHSGDPAYEALPAYFEKRFRPALAGLLESAESAGAIRAGVDPLDLLSAVASLSASGRHNDPARPRRIIGLLLDGLRYGANRNAAQA